MRGFLRNYIPAGRHKTASADGAGKLGKRDFQYADRAGSRQIQDRAALFEDTDDGAIPASASDPQPVRKIRAAV